MALQLLLNLSTNETHVTPAKGGKPDIVFGNETVYIPFAISVFGIIGNVMTFVTIVRTEHLRKNYANAYILVLLCSDTVALLQMFLRFWVEIDTLCVVMCYIARYVWCTAIYVSNLAIISLTLERFFAIVFPLQHMARADLSRWKIICAWLFPTLALSANIFYALKSTKHDSVDMHYLSEKTSPIKCTFDYERPFVDIIFHIPRLVFSFLLTTFVVVGVNLVIIIKLRARAIFTGESRSRETQATSIVLVVIPLIYVLLNTPFWTRNAVKFFTSSNKANTKYLRLHYTLSTSIYMLFCATFATNFLIYALISPKFRATFLHVWLCRPDARSKSSATQKTNTTSVRMTSGNNSSGNNAGGRVPSLSDSELMRMATVAGVDGGRETV